MFLAALLGGQALHAVKVKLMDPPTGELVHVQQRSFPVHLEDAVLGDWMKLYWSLRLNENPHMPIDILDASEEGKLVFNLTKEMPNGTYQILVRHVLSSPQDEVVATVTVNVPEARSRTFMADDKLVVDQSRFQVFQKIRMDVALGTFRLTQEYQRRLNDLESQKRPGEDQECFASVECPMLEQIFLEFATNLEQLGEANDLMDRSFQMSRNRTEVQALAPRMKLLRSHLEGLKLGLVEGPYATAYMTASLKKRFATLMAKYPEALQEAIDRKRQVAERKAKEKVLSEAVAKRLAERASLRREESKVHQAETKAIARQRAEVEGTLRTPSLEEELAEKEFREEERQDHLRFEAKRRAGRPLRKSGSASSSSSSSSSSSDAPALRSVRWHEDAETKDLARVPQGPASDSVLESVRKLRETGRLRGSKSVAPGIYELRPCGGQSTWRPFYALHEGGFVILAVGREALENPSGFEEGRDQAIERLERLRAEGIGISNGPE
ncbi:MAG: hypothetical protein P4L36_03055 [Holophaga sp.]|nr:hypothetical protein [Holophaga sp.]